jgi:hypothetical protein
MLAPGDLAKIAELCKAIGNEVTDDAGFVPVRRLLNRFDADLVIRPLLVEGMLASRGQHLASDNEKKWLVLIDSETYASSMRDVEEERVTRALPDRLRNTVAHELVHSLAFRPSEFGVRLKARTDTQQNFRKFVQALERETEQLSPLLLWSDKGLAKLLHGRKEPLSLFDLLFVVQNFGISRYVLINRLRLLRPTDADGYLFKAGMRDLGIGIGVWGAKAAYIKGWPLFWNFEDGMVPSFLLKAVGHDRLPADAILSDDALAMRGGPNNIAELETSAGTPALPEARKRKVKISVEEGLRKPGTEFLFTVHGVSSVQP